MSASRTSARKSKGIPPKRYGEDDSFPIRKSTSCISFHDDEMEKEEADDITERSGDNTLTADEENQNHSSDDESEDIKEDIKEDNELPSEDKTEDKIFKLTEELKKLTFEFQKLRSKGSIETKENPVKKIKKTKETEIPYTDSKESKPPYMEIMSTFMARQTKMDLPKFGGNPEDWLLFKNEYHRTTDMCKFTSNENVTRLRVALKDEALDAVRSLLISPDSADKIIKILERRFGRPDYIINSLILKTKDILPAKEDKPMSIIKFATAVENLTGMIELLNKSEYLSNPQLIQDLEKKLPPTLHIMWSDFIYEKDSYNLRNFADWLDRKSHAASLRVQPESLPSISTKRTQRLNTAIKSDDNIKCKVCSSNCKSVARCKKFFEMTVDERWKFVTKASLCFSCLNENHSMQVCRKKITCNIDNCKKQHHHLLHSNRTSPQNQSSELCAQSSSADFPTNLRILPVCLKNGDIEVKTLAMLDSGASLTLMRSDIADKLKINGTHSPLSVKWFNGDSAHELDSKCFSTAIKGTFNGAKFYKLRDVRTVKELPLIHQTINRKKITEKYPYLNEIDFESFENGQPTILIGENNGLLSSTRQLIHDKWNSPIASKTWLGWTISGNDGSRYNHNKKALIANVVSNQNDIELHDLVKSFWELDGINTTKTNSEKSRDDDRALHILAETTKRVSEDRWESGLLWKFENIPLPLDSKKMAFKRLQMLEKRLDKDDILKSAYQSNISEYIKKGYLQEITSVPKNRENRQWYLPHFPVVNPYKPGKVRMVFDAAAKCNGASLNDMLLQGPDMLKSLPGVILRFRQGTIGFIADIKEMFHRVQIRDDDCYSQLILWRGCKRQGEPKTYKMTAMTFGATCSPCTAIYVKDKNADQFVTEYPNAVNAIKRSHYMDDYLGTASNEEEAISIIKDIIKIHGCGGFELRNWYSTSAKVNQTIPQHLLPANKNGKINIDNSMQLNRVLGVAWDTAEDVFTFNTNFSKVDSTLLSGERTPTKREALKIIMSVFDPLGFIAHFVIVGKIILQKIWKTSIDWDDELSAELDAEWKEWLQNLQQIECVQIPRCYSDFYLNGPFVELHCFVDASEEAYSTVVYVRTLTKNNITVSFVAAKAKVKPSKPVMTIPRLELQAALLGARLTSHLKEDLDRKLDRIIYWTDSATVWYWIQSSSSRHKQFVANRLSEISELTVAKEWRWLPTKLNVADDATRSGYKELSPTNRWFTGPEFLYSEESKWPKNKLDPVDDELLEFIGVITKNHPFQLPDVKRFSSWLRLIRSTAWMLRFIKNYAFKQNHSGELSPDEVHDAELLWIQQSQRRMFAKEYKTLFRKQEIDKNSPIYKLSPKLTDDNIIRLNGRLCKLSDGDDWFKFPVILHGNDDYVKLLVRHYHLKGNHIGHERVLNELHQRYWIIKVRPTLKKVRRECNACINNNSKPATTIMGQLPSARITSGIPPFCFTGVDYFGPITIKIGRRHEKRYGVIFTCLTLRAIHIEIATNLSTDSFIMALRRFISRRGCPQELFSDNGTNFRGAEKELKRNLAEFDQDEISRQLTTQRIKWNFNPPAAPHMGGCWERLVRSVKNAFKAVLKEHYPTDEDLNTLMTEAEHQINSRPLIDVPTHPDEPEALTPNHFLIGRSSATAPIGRFSKTDLILRKHWRATQHLADQFWKRWRTEYLPTLNRRTKWLSRGEGVKVGDIVLVVDNNTIRGCWPKGIITKIFPGDDGETRVVEVKTSTGVFKRPLVKICVLNFHRDGNEDHTGSNTTGENVRKI